MTTVRPHSFVDNLDTSRWHKPCHNPAYETLILMATKLPSDLLYFVEVIRSAVHAAET
jgi:hypothetical protein